MTLTLRPTGNDVGLPQPILLANRKERRLLEDDDGVTFCTRAIKAGYFLITFGEGYGVVTPAIS